MAARVCTGPPVTAPVDIPINVASCIVTASVHTGNPTAHNFPAQGAARPGAGAAQPEQQPAIPPESVRASVPSHAEKQANSSQFDRLARLLASAPSIPVLLSRSAPQAGSDGAANSINGSTGRAFKLLAAPQMTGGPEVDRLRSCNVTHEQDAVARINAANRATAEEGHGDPVKQFLPPDFQPNTTKGAKGGVLCVSDRRMQAERRGEEGRHAGFDA